MSGTLQRKIDYYEFLIDFVAHEIRNPLTAISMFGRLLREGTYGAVIPEQEKVLDRILANVGRMEHMLDDFLHLGRLEGGEFLQQEELQLHRDLIRPALDALENKLLFPHEQRGRIRSESPGDACLRGDRGLLRVVFDNLFFNAVKYGREGVEIVYGWREEEGGLLLWVRNEGQGVRKKDLERIFRKFVRIKDPRIPSRNGTGLGLYNDRRIIAMHGGRMWAESRYGSDFTVFFTLPAAGEPVTAMRPPAEVPSP